MILLFHLHLADSDSLRIGRLLLIDENNQSIKNIYFSAE
jgi:hypothetical protein